MHRALILQLAQFDNWNDLAPTLGVPIMEVRLYCGYSLQRKRLVGVSKEVLCKVIIRGADGEIQGPASAAPNQRRTKQEVWIGQVWMLWVCWTQIWSPSLAISESNLWTLWEGRTSGRVLRGKEPRPQTQVDWKTQESRRNLILKRTHLIKKRDVVIRSNVHFLLH